METTVGQRTNRNKKNDEESSCGGKTMPQHPVFCLIRHLVPTSPPLFLLSPKRVWWATPKQLEIQMFLLRWALSQLQTGHTSRLKVLRLDGVIERTLTSCWPNQVQFSRGSKHSIDEWSGCREWCPIDVCSSTLKTNFRSVCLSVQYIPLLHHYPLVSYSPSLPICHSSVFWPP